MPLPNLTREEIELLPITPEQKRAWGAMAAQRAIAAPEPGRTDQAMTPEERLAHFADVPGGLPEPTAYEPRMSGMVGAGPQGHLSPENQAFLSPDGQTEMEMRRMSGGIPSSDLYAYAEQEAGPLGVDSAVTQPEFSSTAESETPTVIDVGDLTGGRAPAAAPIAPEEAPQVPEVGSASDVASAIRQRGEVEAAAAEERAKADERGFNLRQAEYARQLEAENDRKDAIKGVENRIATARKDYAEHPEIEDRRPIAAKIFGAIAMGLGAYGSSLTGGPNVAFQIVSQAIEEDLDRQRTELEKKGKKVTGIVNELDRLRQKHGDERGAEELYRLSVWDQVKREAVKASAPFESALIRAKANELSMGADAKAAEIQSAEESRAIRDRVAQRGVAVQERAQRANAKAALAKANAVGAVRRVNEGMYIPEGYSISPTEMKEARKYASDANKMVIAIDEMIAEARKGGSIDFGDRAQGESSFAKAAAAYKDFKKLGTYDEGVENLLTAVTGGNPRQMTLKELGPILNRLRGSMIDEANVTMSQQYNAVGDPFARYNLRMKSRMDKYKRASKQ